MVKKNPESAFRLSICLQGKPILLFLHCAETRLVVIIVTCPKRLAPYLEQEIRELGFSIDETFITGVRLSGTINDCIRLNLNLRCASQVLFSLKKFEARDADAIYNNLLTYPWETILPDPGYFSN